ncbi:MAG: hypothetical protein AVDCRST_MAG18-3431 [uncultured Thermomicrobiales bacterium]|uniref:Uncharacterized protein n=1 Tax=uncultured Thermomicrobiales bacterium TaxID=1645740 RepID=A0A6J4VMF1_9BACT|nr:MAG: hypothetical protein AVDCRST_MAG18-3431 [uncultured Thermomicrobiales bacterium]
MSGAAVPSPIASPAPGQELARWLAAHPRATLLEIAARVAGRDPGAQASAAAGAIPDECPPSR